MILYIKISFAKLNYTYYLYKITMCNEMILTLLVLFLKQIIMLIPFYHFTTMTQDIMNLFLFDIFNFIHTLRSSRSSLFSKI